MEIDDIFGELQNNKARKIKETTKRKDDIKIEKEDLKYIVGKDGRKYYDGLPIYTSEELNLGKSKNTKDCPFLCDCCY